MAAEDDKIINSPDTAYLAHPGGLGCTFFERMWEHQDKIAQVNTLTGEEESYESLMQRCVRAAMKMQSVGVTQDDVINICSFNNMDVCVPYIASLFVGAKPSTLDPLLPLQDTIHALKQLKPKLIFADLDTLKQVEEAIAEARLQSKIVLFGNTLKHLPFKEFLRRHPDEDDFKPTSAESLHDTAAILFTSGTTGLPKGVCLNHYGFILTGHQAGQLLHMTRMLSFTSYLCVSTIDLLISSVLYGGCNVVVPKFEPNEFWQHLDAYKPTIILLPPSYVRSILKTSRPKSKLNLKMVLLSGSWIPENVMKDFQEVMPEASVLLAYSQTELNGLATVFDVSNPNELAWSEEKVSSSGTALPGFSMKIVDIETKELLGPYQRGELRVKSKLMMNGYHNMDSSPVWDAEGWFKTGDLAYYDEDHCFYIVDCIKEMFKYKSTYVIPANVEAVILQHPAVEAVIVIGIPHEEDVNHPMALIELSKTAKDVTADTILNFVEQRVDDVQKLRAGVKIIKKLPISSTGKIRRGDLRDKVLRGEI